MLINTGTQERFLTEATAAAGTSSRDGSIKSDSLLATLFVNSVSAGDLTVSVYTLTDANREVLLFTFPTISAPTSFLLLKKSAVSLQRFRVTASYSGAVDYEVYIRAITGAGESSTKILGSESLLTDSATVTPSPDVLIASSLTDRSGIVIKNWGSAGNIFVSEDISKLPSRGYPLAPRDGLALDIAAGVTLYAVSDAGSVDVRIAQAGT